MEELSLLAKQYYAEFEKNDWRNKWIWISILIWGVFVVLLGINLAQGMEVNKASFVLLLAAEFLGLWVIEKVKSDRKKSILEKYNSIYSNMLQPELFKDVSACKCHFLMVVFNKAEKNYLSFASEIAGAIALQDSLRSNFDKSISQWYLNIYNPESKQRINAWLIVLFSTLMLLSIKDKEGAYLSAVFEFYSEMTLPIMILLSFYIAAIYGLLFLTQSLLRLLLGVVFRGADFEIKYLLRDLVRFHDFLGNKSN